MTKVNTKKRKKQYHIFNNFRGLVETLPDGELPYVYFVTMINCRLDNDDNVRQRPGTGMNSYLSGLLEDVTDADVFLMPRTFSKELWVGYTQHDSPDYPDSNFTYDPLYLTTDITYEVGIDDYATVATYNITVEEGRTYTFKGQATAQTGNSRSEAYAKLTFGQVGDIEVDLATGGVVSATYVAKSDTFKIQLLGYSASGERHHFKYENFSLKDVESSEEVALFCSGDNLLEVDAYKLKTAQAPSMTSKGTGLDYRPCDMTQFNQNVYIFNGAKYFVYTGLAPMAEVTPKIPTISIGRTPLGVGTDFEEPNALTDEFTDSFNGDGTSTSYKMSYAELEADTILVKVNSVPKTEGVDFTVNRTSGIVDFSSGSAPFGAPPTGTDNVLITGVKAGIGDATLITGCRFATLYSGPSDTRLFCSGNPEHPNFVYWSDVNDATYYPIGNSSELGDDYAVRGFVKHYNKLVVVKERGVFVKEYEDDPTLGVVFTQKKVNSKRGTDTVDQVVLVNNNPMVLNGNGLYEMVIVDQLDERNFELRSEDVEESLLRANLSIAKIFDNEKDFELYIAIDDEIWVYNYKKNVWYAWYGIYMSAGFEYNGTFYFVGGEYGHTLNWLDEDLLNDNDGVALWEQPIDAFLEMAFWDFGFPNYYKTLDYFIMTADKDVGVRCDVTLISELGIDEAITINPIFSTIDFGNIDFGNFTFETMYAPNPDIERVDFRDFILLKIRFRNNYLDSKLSLNSIKLDFRVGRLVR